MADDVDRALLSTLMDRGRATWAQLSGRVGLTAPSVTERVRKLERAGIIRGYEAVVDPTSVGYGLLAYVSVEAAVAFDPPEFFERVAETREIQECHLLTGDYDYLLKVRCRGSAHLYELLQAIQGWPGVGHTRSAVVLKTAKETRAVPLDAME
ncbi:MAG TPA: Lrp/AsnC family transcriptional regulator [Longimicrobiales bacterium]|nr:Lrp/AsnC family transcriptional regulator [Longimicrobiales bacterium]